MPVRLFLAGIALLAMASAALAHPDHDSHAGGFLGGFAHPLLGLDHIAAMMAIGLWAAFLGGKAKWRVPAAFVLTMIASFLLATAGVPFPGVEPGIAASVLILGLLIAAAVRLPIAASTGMVVLVALFHGHAHGTELTGNALMFGLGFVVATTLLQAAGLGLGTTLAQQRPAFARGIGATIAGLGLVLVGGLT